MFEREGSAPDATDSGDRAVRVCDPPVPVWADLSVLQGPTVRGPGHLGRGGVVVGDLVRGVMWARIMSTSGVWLGMVRVELERGGRPVMTVETLLPQRALRRRRPGESRARAGESKASNRPTGAQRSGRRSQS